MKCRIQATEHGLKDTRTGKLKDKKKGTRTEGHQIKNVNNRRKKTDR